jgi:oligopeptide transport system permease protein
MTAEVFSIPDTTPRGRSLGQDAWARLRKNRLSMVCGFILIGIFLLCYIGPFFCAYSVDEQNLELKATPPSAERVFSKDPDGNARHAAHWFGTDETGRDQLVRVLTGGRVSLNVGLLATAVSLIIGVAYGATAGYLGGRTDAFMMRIVDVLYSLPFMVFVILLTVAFGRSMWLLYLAIGAVEWLTMARIVRAGVQSQARMEFVEAARSLGLSDSRIIFRHIVPNVLGPVIVYTTLTVPAVMLLEAALSFLGLGVQPPHSSWGSLIDQGAKSMETYPWLLIIPAVFFSLTLFCLNFVGDGLRDAIDVKSGKD